MQRSLVLLFLCAATTAVAQERGAAWEHGGRYLCRAESTRVCEGREGACELRAGVAVFTVDFEHNTVRVFGAPEDNGEQIVWRKYQRYDGSTLPDTNVIYLSGGGRMIQFGHPSRGRILVAADVLPAVFVDASIDHVITHFLQCQPDH